MNYQVERVLPFSAEQVWKVLSDVRHFARRDPFHDQLEFLTAQTEGKGTAFKVRHRYAPIFPFGADEVHCTVTRFEPGVRLVLSEKNTRHAFKNHSQGFTLEPKGEGTRVVFEIRYSGVPWVLLPWRLWVNWRVTSRMKDKLAELEEDCAQPSAALAA